MPIVSLHFPARKPIISLQYIIYMSSFLSLVAVCYVMSRLKINIPTTFQKQEGNEILGKKSGRCLDFLDTLITARDENGVGLTFREIRDEVDTFLFEGTNTNNDQFSKCIRYLHIKSGRNFEHNLQMV